VQAMAKYRVVGQWILAAGLLPLSALPAYAQGVGTPYGSPNPALSPWLNLYQKQGGPLDPYHMFVQPQVQLRDTVQQQQANLQRQTAGLSALGDYVTQMADDRNHQKIAPTGVGAGFMTHGRYFGVQASGAGHGPAAGHGGRRTWTPPPAQSSGAGRG
jgi:hypothetical protein